jgi:transmembrane sensor
MSGRGETDRNGEVAETAARWFARLQDEAATAEEWRAFEAWLSASPAHARAYERLEEIWVELDEAALPARGALRGARSGMTRRGWLVAGGALAAGVTAAVVGLSLPGAPEARVYAAAPGETRTFRLADGTTMRLNAATQVSVRLARASRRVEMQEGEAAFDVAHDPARPFLIAAGDREIRVVGTEFNVRRRDGEMELTVRRGVVEVRPADGGRPPTRVHAGERLTHRDGLPGVSLSKVEPHAAFAWTEGQLVYRDAPMSKVAADLTRSLGVPVRVADPLTGRLRFTGVLSLDDRAAVARRLEAFAPVKVERAGGGLLVRKAP